MTNPDASLSVAFDASSKGAFQALTVRGATWVEYRLALDNTPVFTAEFGAPSAHILHETRDIGGAAVAARALWNWRLAAQLETALGDDPNANFARRTMENEWQQVLAVLKIPALKIQNLRERAQPYRVHLSAPTPEIQNRALLEHGFCDETLSIQWQQKQSHCVKSYCVEWRAADFWFDDEIITLPERTLLNAPGGVQVLAAALCRAMLENQSIETALQWARAVVAK